MMNRIVAALTLTAAIAWTAPDSAAPQTPDDTADTLGYTFYDSLYASELPMDTFTYLLPEYVGFGVGEKLVFAVQYSLVKAGEASLEVRNIADIDGRPCYRIVSDARTNKFFSGVFKVRDRFESYMDTAVSNATSR